MKVFNNHDQPDENNCKCLVCLLKKCSIGWKKTNLELWNWNLPRHKILSLRTNSTAQEKPGKN